MGNSFSDRFGMMTRWYNQQGPYPVLFTILAALLLVQATRLIWLVLTPLGPVGDYRANDVEILSPQSRLTLFSSFDPFFRTGAAQSANVVTSLQLTLFGIRMNEASGLGSAILSGPDGVQTNYGVGEEIMSGVTLDSVEFDHVIISRGGVLESLYLDQSIPAQTVGTEDPVAPASLSLESNEIPGVASLAPRNDQGRVTGIVLSPLGDGSLFKSAGFRNGDIIVSINGNPVGSASDIESLKSQVRPGARLSVEVERGADTVPVAVNLGAQ
ncbi:type II secretion system protein N [Sphingorhabdus sp. M41]|uniref:type II secretion system protein N n=1 Tax=Sphingorhabdus sp. M41 TaxID=1806885 RepID=UPI0012E8B29F|nr:type II secretion system protein N [Sphingorhabdus sp. M41]